MAKLLGDFFSNFWAFLEYLNFAYIVRISYGYITYLHIKIESEDGKQDMNHDNI